MKKILIVPTLGLNLEGITSVIHNYTNFMDRSGLQLHFMTYGELNPALREKFEKLGEILFVSDRKQSTLAYVKDYVALLNVSLLLLCPTDMPDTSSSYCSSIRCSVSMSSARRIFPCLSATALANSS